MSAFIIDGKSIAKRIKEELRPKVLGLAEQGKQPGLAVVIVGDNSASRVYVNMKKKACSELGIYSEEHALPATIRQDQLLDLIRDLNRNPRIHGILVQLPLPDHLDEQLVIETIDPAKDVDGFHPMSVGKLMIGLPGFPPCTPAGVMELIKTTGISLSGKECVVIGRSNIVGKPQAILLLRENGTVTICHSKTENLAEVCRRADVLIAAVGRPEMITGEMIKPGAIVIDVGMNRKPDGKLVGDVHFESACSVAGWITPVPGGVGPMTIAMLMKNTVQSANERA